MRGFQSVSAIIGLVTLFMQEITQLTPAKIHMGYRCNSLKILLPAPTGKRDKRGERRRWQKPSDLPKVTQQAVAGAGKTSISHQPGALTPVLNCVDEWKLQIGCKGLSLKKILFFKGSIKKNGSELLHLINTFPVMETPGLHVW